MAGIILCHNGTTGNFDCLGLAPAVGGIYLTGAFGAGYYTFGSAIAILKAIQP